MKRAIWTIAICLLGSILMPRSAVAAPKYHFDEEIAEAKKNHDNKKLGTVLLARATVFFNNGMAAVP